MDRFHNTRVRLARIADDKDFYGWVMPESHQWLVVQTDMLDAMELGDKFEANLSSNAASAKFETSLGGKNGGLAYLTVPSLIRIGPPTEIGRRRVSTMAATLSSATGPKEFEVVDISPTGLAFLSGDSFSNGDEIHLLVHSPLGDIAVRGAVVYSRFVQDGNKFRTGVQLSGLARIESARWKQLLAS